MTDDEYLKAVETANALAVLAQLIPAGAMFEAVRTERVRARADGASATQVALLDEQLGMFDLIEQLAESAGKIKALAEVLAAPADEEPPPPEPDRGAGWPDDWVQPTK